jgi:hypothetical protein
VSHTKQWTFPAPSVRPVGTPGAYRVTFIGDSEAFDGSRPASAMLLCRVAEYDDFGVLIREREIDLPVGALLQLAAEAFLSREIAQLESLVDPVAYYLNRKQPR